MTRSVSPSSARAAFAILTVIVVIAMSATRSAQAAPPAVAKRVPWTESKIQGMPEPPPPYTTEPVFPKLKFQEGVVIARAPGWSRLFVGELKGKIYSFPNDPQVAGPDLALDLMKSVPELTMFYGLAFHPKFAENRYVYLCYACRNEDPQGTRLTRMKVIQDDPPVFDPKSETVILTWLAGGHNGACIEFGPDGMLYASSGDAAGPSPPDPLLSGQDMGSLAGKILRIDVDREADGKRYAIPSDNPFISLKGARPEIWALGFRNPWKMNFDLQHPGVLWVGDVGWELWEMIHKVERGTNHGWSVTEGPQPVLPNQKSGPGPIRQPFVKHPHSEAASITGGYVYRGKRLPELTGAYIYGDYQTGRIWAFRHDGKVPTWTKELARTALELVAFGEDRDGELYLLDHHRTNGIHRLVPNPAYSPTAGASFPRKLSQTGLFASTSEHKPAPGVIRYDVRAPLWADGATAERFLGLPGQSTLKIGEKNVVSFPEGTVAARTVSVELRAGDPKSAKRLETQVLHFEKGSWRPYVYVWSDDQTDAALDPGEGASRVFKIADPQAAGGAREWIYRTSGRGECMLCHNPWNSGGAPLGEQSAPPLALNIGQWNLDGGHGDDNQLTKFEQAGLFAQGLPCHPVDLPKLTDPYDAQENREERVRAYWQVNCAHCHQFNAGGVANLQLPLETPLDKTRTVNEVPGQGGLGLDNARIVAPGRPESSTMFYRLATVGGGRMPRLGSRSVDERALKLFAEWIEGLPGAETAKVEEPAIEPANFAKLTANPTAALRLARRLLDLPPTEAQALGIAIARGVKNHPSTEVRDLFERFLPSDERKQRLGDGFDPAIVLALAGDAQRGEQVFLSNAAAQCKSCHKLSGQGIELGPDLSKIGEKYAKPQMLDHILRPSLAIDQAFVVYVVETKDGRVLSGVIAEKTPDRIVLRDSKNERSQVSAADVEQLTPQTKSLMPEGLMRDLTPQEAADLLEFLATRRPVGGSGKPISP